MSQQKIITNWEDVPVYMDLSYAALLLGFKVKTIESKARAGEIPAAKIFGE